MTAPAAPFDREDFAASLRLVCPVCRAVLAPQRADYGGTGHRRTCYRCGLVLVLPRVGLVRAARRVLGGGR